MHVGIIGAGFTGCMLAVHLLRQARAGITISLIENGPDVGRGAAYGTDNPSHLLNVRAANMSAFADDPSHFLRWLWKKESEEPYNSQIPPSGHAFVSRSTYGDYIASVFQEMIDAHAAQSNVSIIPQAATELHEGPRPAVTLADGRRLSFDAVVLCVGNFPSAPPTGAGAEVLTSGRFLAGNGYWHALRDIQPDDGVLIIGSGLTMADTVQSLARTQHKGPVHVISRHGLMPLPHEPARAYEMATPSGGVLEIFRQVRGEVRRAAQKGYNWRHVVDAVRPSLRKIWQGWSTAERSQFLRHVRPYWDLHRHRLAPAVAEEIADLDRAGRLRVTAGRIEAISWRNDTFAVTYRLRGTDTVCTVHPVWIINCTGPQSDYRGIPDVLVQGALERGVIRSDPMRLGIDVTDDNRVIGADDTASSNIFAVGPPTKGIFWEVTAVPDIRTECERVAALLIDAG